MSPCETLTLPSKGAVPGALPVSLEEYGVSTNGFLPSEPPLERLPNPYYSPWESLIASLPTLLEQQTFRSQVDRLPILSTEHLSSEQEWRRACVVLGFLAHAYIWGGETPAEILPPPITIPFLAASSHLGIPPVASYACLNLWNFRSASLNPANLDSLHALHTFTGTEDESWFYMVSVAMEAQGGYIIPVMLHALESLHHHHHPEQQSPAVYNTTIASLDELTSCIGTLGKLLDRMDERCRPPVFYHRIRPFLAGSKNMSAAGLPRGVFYDEGDNGGRKGEWRELRGGSNGQSSLIQFLDLVLGVEHAVQGNSGPEQKQSQSRRGDGAGKEGRRMGRYPGGMRAGVSRLLGLEEVGEGEGGGGLRQQQLAVREAFQTATKALAEFRNKHLQLVTRYIIIPSRQPNGCTGLNLATVSSKLRSEPGVEGRQGSTPKARGELTGTGGTELLPFLKQSRDETFQAGQLQVRKVLSVEH
ncbi:Indoleamine 2,3-dioxygenase [Chaetomium strumarium]|uniref:Indoleamine 2,3-dioxygenase n=1 Tax=Chaetomium strumarium TaxID=1170767 RepID=A0AAJ0GKT7_9PEZI|nr:Indoleamine 2,3-dioxygenase [Chaetomium strumarium]